MVLDKAWHIGRMNSKNPSTSLATSVPQPMAHYFVDESGDGVLFGKQGKVLLGQPGVCGQFMLGMLEVSDPSGLAKALEGLRQDLLADPYFKSVPSMQPNRYKTAVMLHAKDDLPEVRREVFKLLAQHDIKFYAVVRDMRAVLAYALERKTRDNTYLYNPNELYDSCVALLFKDRLHAYESCSIHYGVRGTVDRMRAFQTALDLARSRFEQKWSQQVTTHIDLQPSRPQKVICLQAVDYVLWALQRYYNAQESRFIDLLGDKVSLIHAVDEVTSSVDGAYFTKKKPLPELPGAAL
jgi:Protein of unknown function (DUF3800)